MEALQLVKDVMKLVTDNQPRERIVSQAKEVKSQMANAKRELEQAMILLDSLVATFAPDLIEPPPKSTNDRQQLVTSKKSSHAHVQELAQKYEANGVIDTSLIINQLRAEGDTRSERGMAISVGNILSRSGYHSIGTGKYAKTT